MMFSSFKINLSIVRNINISFAGRFHHVRHQEERDRRRLRPEVGGKLSGTRSLGRSSHSRQERSGQPSQEASREQEQKRKSQKTLQRFNELCVNKRVYVLYYKSGYFMLNSKINYLLFQMKRILII